MAVPPFGTTASITGLISATLLAWRARRKKSLSKTGAATGFVVGFLMVATGMRGLILFYFYQVGTWATKYKHQQKMQMDGTTEQAAERGAMQVLCVSIIALVLSLGHALWHGEEQPILFPGASESSQWWSPSHLTCGIVAHHATCLADTLASEMGMLAQGQPFLVTKPWKRVPPGTNGGITWYGLGWSLLGGGLIGVFYLLTDYAAGTVPTISSPVSMLLFSSLCGLIGSIFDSLLGAVVQSTYWNESTKQVVHRPDSTTKQICGSNLLSNEQVNLVSTAMATYVGGWMLGPLIFWQS